VLFIIKYIIDIDQTQVPINVHASTFTKSGIEFNFNCEYRLFWFGNLENLKLDYRYKIQEFLAILCAIILITSLVSYEENLSCRKTTKNISLLTQIKNYFKDSTKTKANLQSIYNRSTQYMALSIIIIFCKLDSTNFSKSLPLVRLIKIAPYFCTFLFGKDYLNLYHVYDNLNNQKYYEQKVRKQKKLVSDVRRDLAEFASQNNEFLLRNAELELRLEGCQCLNYEVDEESDITCPAYREGSSEVLTSPPDEIIFEDGDVYVLDEVLPCYNSDNISELSEAII